MGWELKLQGEIPLQPKVELRERPPTGLDSPPTGATQLKLGRAPDSIPPPSGQRP